MLFNYIFILQNLVCGDRLVLKGNVMLQNPNVGAPSLRAMSDLGIALFV